ncbi:TrkA-N domain-containing protein [Halococcus morrhuae DSM 1307]|uniref:TrkA-N domain-containing protein n=1 Tax=Halococcus morrhuae DSM 1307 TaxID=931277 RepID=M0N2J7_HALMO|nr:cation:proton antiporter [Halococcus morrhuae]EMA51354.1 TrkA-N domain-containing protein [Halococcus morrhuae DSM 1307]
MARVELLVALVALVFTIGIFAQVLADRYRIPSIIFLIVAGIVLGPEGLGIVTREAFGVALPVIVDLSVALIVFEGAFHLRYEDLKATRSTRLRLITVGALISLVGTAITVRFALGTPWDLAFLIGSLLVATGPTVIDPILDVVAVRDSVANALSFEGVVNDVTAAILAYVSFEVVLAEQPTRIAFLEEFAARLAIGIVVGALVAVVLRSLIRAVDRAAGNAAQNARLLALAGAFVAYAGATLLAEEAGIAAAATAGLALGNLDVPYKETISEFKGDVTTLLLSFIFIALAALLSFDDIAALGVGGLVVVVAVMFVIRPLLVFISTRGRQFSRDERLFMSLIGPRGIIPASVATLFAVELTDAGLPEQATTLVGTVFLVILATVVLEGGLAPYIASALDVVPMQIVIVGGGTVGRGLAERFDAHGENPVLIESDADIARRARDDGHTVHVGDGTVAETLRDVGVADAKLLVVATGDDDANLLAAQLARSTFDVDHIIARVNEPENTDAFEDLGVRAISPTESAIWAIDNLVERPALLKWTVELGQSGDVREVDVTADATVGRSIAAVRNDLPSECLLALVNRDGTNHYPGDDFDLERGDTVTLLGRTEAVDDARALFGRTG